MAASVKPEGGSSGNPIPKTIPSTPPTNPGAGQPTEGASVEPAGSEAGKGVPQEELDRLKRLVAAQEAALRDQNRLLTEHTQRMREFEKNARPAEPTVDDQNQDFWKNPVGTMTKLIEKELARTVGPLNERIQRETSLTAHERAKLALKEKFSDIWDKIEPSIDQFVEGARAQGVEINSQVMDVAALTAAGMYYRGDIPGHDPKPREEVRVVTPPHLRPSAPTIPGAEPEKKEARQLTENERRLARERKMTDEQYLEWLEVPPEDIVKSKIGRAS